MCIYMYLIYTNSYAIAHMRTSNAYLSVYLYIYIIYKEKIHNIQLLKCGNTYFHMYEYLIRATSPFLIEETAYVASEIRRKATLAPTTLWWNPS